MLFVDGLRHERESATSAYHQFLLRDSKFPGNIHAFFEGQDDLSFYMNFLHKFTSDTNYIHVYKCGNKRGVYETYSKIMYLNRQGIPLFFVDKDLSDIMEEEWEEAPNIYITDYYSIENYLVTEDMLSRVWTELFHFINIILDFNEIHQKKFREELERFYQFVLPITAWIVYLRRRGKRPNVNNINFSTLFKFSDNLNLEKCEKLEQVGEVKLLEEICGEETPDSWQEDSQYVIRELAALMPKTYIRGKLEMCFFVKFIEKLRKAIDSTISGDGRVSIRTHLSDENAVEILGPRLFIPHSLESFLQKNLG